jgi:hypothetical protein
MILGCVLFLLIAFLLRLDTATVVLGLLFIIGINVFGEALGSYILSVLPKG